MTWTKTGAEFPEDCNALSDTAYRVHHGTISYLTRRERSTLKVSHAEVACITWSPDWENGVRELVTARFWKTTPDGGYQVIHHADVIRASLIAQQAQRERNARAQQAKRDRTAGKTSTRPRHVSADISAYVSDDVSARVSASASTDQTSSTNAKEQQPAQHPPGNEPAPRDNHSTHCTACDKPARNGCRTCWEHAHLELGLAG